jgi:hypothetical protein
VIRGGWEKIKSEYYDEITVWRSFKVLNEDTAELWIVTPDGTKEGWSFKKDSIIQKGPQVIQFNKEDVKNELSAVEQENALVSDERGIVVGNLKEEHYLLKCQVCGTTTVLKEISPGTTLEDELGEKTCSRCGSHGNWKVISTF